MSVVSIVKDYQQHKTITSQNVSSQAQVKNLLFRRKLCSVLNIFKCLYFDHCLIYHIYDAMMSIST